MKVVLWLAALFVIMAFGLFWARGHDISAFNFFVIFGCGTIFGWLIDIW